VHELIAWSGFVGAWLLVAGPLFQAAVELDEQGDKWSGLNRAALAVGPQPRLSPWWWLLPPVAYVLQRRRQRDHRRQVFDSLTLEEVEGFIGLTSVATGWAMVAAGALFIAVKETYEVVELYAWPRWLFVVLLLVMLAVCAGNTVVRIRRAHQLIGAQQRTSPSSPASSTA
jgi:hypothetical protein